MHDKKSNAGAKPKLTYDDAKKLLYMFKDKYKPLGEISADAIWKYTKQLQEEGVIESVPTKDFWSHKPRIGYKVRMEYKAVLSPPTILPEGRGPIVPKISDLLKKKWYNREDVEKEVFPLEDFANKILKKLNLVTEELEKSQQEILSLKSNKVALQTKVSAAEEAVLLLYLYIQKESNKTTKELAKRTLENIYNQSNPLDYFKDYMSPHKDSLIADSSKRTEVPKLSEFARIKRK